MKSDAMKDALTRRKGKGIDLTIIIGEPKEDKKDENSELAPEVNDADEMQEQELMGPPGMNAEEGQGNLGDMIAKHEKDDEAQDKALISKMMSQHELEEGDEPANSIGAKARNLMRAKMKK